jgi:hypothetical protein
MKLWDANAKFWKEKNMNISQVANYNGLKPLPRMWPSLQPCRLCKTLYACCTKTS